MAGLIDPADVLGLAPMAGRGTRLGLRGSKEIVPLDGSASATGAGLCDVMLQRMCEAGLREAVLVIADGKSDIRDHLGDRFAASTGSKLVLHYVSANDSPNTPTSIAAAFDQMRGRNCALGFADILYQPCAGYARALGMLADTNADIVLGLFPTAQPTAVDMVAFDAVGTVKEILIKQAAGARYAYTWSLAVWRPSFTDFMHSWLSAAAAREQGVAVEKQATQKPGETFVGDVVIAAQAAGLRVSAVVVSSQPSLDAGTPEALALARSLDWQL